MRLIIILIANAVSLWAAQAFVDGFSLSLRIWDFALVVLVFSLFTLFLKPLLKLVLSPILILTLGLGIVIVNALLLWALSWALPSFVSITGLYPLAYATVIVSIVGLIIHLLLRPRS